MNRNSGGVHSRLSGIGYRFIKGIIEANKGVWQQPQSISGRDSFSSALLVRKPCHLQRKAFTNHLVKLAPRMGRNLAPDIVQALSEPVVLVPGSNNHPAPACSTTRRFAKATRGSCPRS